jgi:hypothetical protein
MQLEVSSQDVRLLTVSLPFHQHQHMAHHYVASSQTPDEYLYVRKSNPAFVFWLLTDHLHFHNIYCFSLLSRC